MHELSLCYSMVDTVQKAALAARATKVLAVHLRLGRMAGVVKEALLFSYDAAAEGTLLAGSKLIIEDVPVLLYCPDCGKTFEQGELSSYRCPDCGELTGDLRQGRELEIESIEVEEAASL